MSLIDHEQITGERFVRCRAINVMNPVNEQATITFTEEKITLASGEVISAEIISGFVVPFNPADIIPVINPQTGAATGGSISQGEIYAILYSAWLYHRSAQATA